jgi:hypothetical protein
LSVGWGDFDFELWGGEMIAEPERLPTPAQLLDVHSQLDCLLETQLTRNEIALLLALVDAENERGERQ